MEWDKNLTLSEGIVQPYEYSIWRAVGFDDEGVDLRLTRDGNMGREEQIEEREVLDSIFPDEITGESALAWSTYLRLEVG